MLSKLSEGVSRVWFVYNNEVQSRYIIIEDLHLLIQVGGSLEGSVDNQATCCIRAAWRKNIKYYLCRPLGLTSSYQSPTTSL